MKHILRTSMLVILIIILAACANDEATSNEEGNKDEGADEELKIFTTVYPLQYFTKQIAGDQASVESILPPGSDPHTYEPTTKEMVEIAEADAFIYNGAGLEPYAKQISDSIKSEDIKILEAAKGIDLEAHVHNHEEEGNEEGAHEGHNHGDQDPHVWLDPISSVQLAEHIKETLVELNPEQEEAFTKNFEELKGELEILDQEFHSQLEDLPQNKFIVSHAAYGYWEQAYGIEQIAVSGLSPTNEPSQKELENIIEKAEKHNLNHVFFEQNVTPKVAEVVRKEIGAETLRLHNVAVLTEEDIKNEETYLSLMKHNLEQLTKALSNSKSGDSSESEEQSDSDHGHSHGGDEEAQKIYDGYFEDSQVKDRPLSDWEGDWQSVYPYHEDGTLDEVYTHNAEDSEDMTAEEYKEYYEKGYKTDVDRIVIDGATVTFYKDGEEKFGEYTSDGYEILAYEVGNRGVRYIFKLKEEKEGLPQYIQFSDHSIDPTDADHYHLYWGDDREALLDEVTHWPTYYPSDRSGDEIVHAMMQH
ncbi:zinc ABC transporter substrate-binding protein AdcA [Halobacillus halophilus]|uniref:ABC-type transport system extracellular binding protein (Probable substrate Mn/Zn) n=1 Tax=Halobacillus halophilus (strain ATCC 35676 / DSM 2266 / JCM 20832 / KCTC 3685 / LMG 17431 / NBRC 102448 / NCIMB 2269) TaxID=866895 RepID=I0JKZ0_HALH3|nr:ZinT/AdcA family metal-binding protein [Halobacillus halophilus]ASF38933.1 zinc ABC transporter substrate-binding protein AdcA [Halobacillus halophilus]CCG44810.1 ABC-type transport system extracellular binding protein (probable substrate Mn/Zn) [Halobacillus halophilus DSM 2266]